MTGLVGSIITTTEYQVIPFRKGAYTNELTLVMCETSGNNNYVTVRWSRGGTSIFLYYNYPLLAYDTYPRDNSPFRLTLNRGDKVEVKSTIPGVNISLVS